MLARLLSGNFDLTSVLIYILSTLTVVFLTLPVHEFAHGWAATRLGDYTPRYQGRLTLNPLAHIDYIGALCILLFGFGWAKPVQVNSRNFDNPRRDMAITAAAGPAANIIMAFIALLLGNLCYIIPVNHSVVIYVYLFFLYVADINIYLAVFNLIPIPPLDGSRILSAFLPPKYYYKLMQYERYLFILVMALIWSGVLDRPLDFLSSGIMNGLSFVAGLPFKMI